MGSRARSTSAVCRYRTNVAPTLFWPIHRREKYRTPIHHPVEPVPVVITVLRSVKSMRDSAAGLSPETLYPMPCAAMQRKCSVDSTR